MINNLLKVSVVILLVALISACDNSSSLVGKWKHGEHSIVTEFFASGDFTVNDPCNNFMDKSGTYEFIDDQNLKLITGQDTSIFGYVNTDRGFSLDLESNSSRLVGSYASFSDSPVDESKDVKYWYKEEKVGDKYSFVGIENDQGWTATKLGAGQVYGNFYTCEFAYPLLKGSKIYQSKKGFYRDISISILKGLKNPSLHFIQRNDLDYGTLDFRFVLDGYDNTGSLAAQESFLLKYAKGCRYSYGTPIYHESEDNKYIYIPRNCGISWSSFIAARIKVSDDGLVDTYIKLINVPLVSGYGRAGDCSSRYFITGVKGRKVNLRVVATKDYGQSFDSVPNGNCGSDKYPQFSKDITLDIYTGDTT